MTRISLIFVALLLGACAKEETPPVYLTSGPIPIPDHCDPNKIPPVKEPKFAANQDVTDIEAVKDREAWKKAFRTEKAYRSACNQQLKALTGERKAFKPTS